MGARLFVLGGRDVGRTFDLADDTVLGRGEECQVRLRDRSISRRHARIVREGERWILEDLESRNGIRIQGERVPGAELQDYDEFLLGDLPLRFRSGAAGDASAAAPSELPPALPIIEEPPAPGLAEARPRSREKREQDEIELELPEDIQLDPSHAPGSRAGSLEAPVGSVQLRGAVREPVALEISEQDRRRAEILRQGRSHGGWLRGDLSQRPVWVRAIIGLFVLALGVGACLLTFLAVQHLRAT